MAKHNTDGAIVNCPRRARIQLRATPWLASDFGRRSPALRDEVGSPGSFLMDEKAQIRMPADARACPELAKGHGFCIATLTTFL
jgi:hypothetical protein